MEKKNIVFRGLGIFLFILILGGFVVWGILDAKKGSSADRIVEGSNIIYYYGAECPHCKDVKNFFEEKGVREKVVFSEKEVWHNKKNSSEMMEKLNACGIPEEEAGVPFVFARGKCFIGYPDIRDFFETEMSGGNKNE